MHFLFSSRSTWIRLEKGGSGSRLRPTKKLAPEPPLKTGGSGTLQKTIWSFSEEVWLLNRNLRGQVLWEIQTAVCPQVPYDFLTHMCSCSPGIHPGPEWYPFFSVAYFSCSFNVVVLCWYIVLHGPGSRVAEPAMANHCYRFGLLTTSTGTDLESCAPCFLSVFVSIL